MKNYKSGNSFGKSLLAIVALVCIILDGWFAYIHFFGKEKKVSTTATISDIEVSRIDTDTSEVITDKKTFLEVNWYDNCIEIKFNQLYDENQTAFYSYGIQLMIKDGFDKTLTDENIFDGNYGKSIYTEQVQSNKLVYESWNYMQKCKAFYDIYNEVLTNKNYSYLDLYEYQSFDDYETPLQSTFLQDGDEFFKLQAKTGEETNLLALKFKNYETDKDKKLITSDLIKIGSHTNFRYNNYGVFSLKAFYDEITYYRAKDIYYFIESISNSIKGLAPGFAGETYLRTPDIFDLYEFNESEQQYIKTGGIDDLTSKVSSEEIIYSKIKLTVHNGNLTKSSQSIFNKYREIQNYDSNPSDNVMTDYLSGRNVIIATLDDLDWNLVSNTENKYRFSLSEEFKTRWNEYKKTSIIRVLIDTEFLDNSGLSYDGFKFSDEFFIYQIRTTQGEVWYQEVNNV